MRPPRQRVDRGAKFSETAIQRPDDHAGRPADEQRAAVEPARVEADHDRRQRLDDPDAAQQLQLDRVLRAAAKMMKTSAPTLTTSDTILATVRLLRGVQSGLHELAIDVAREQVGARRST